MSREDRRFFSLASQVAREWHRREVVPNQSVACDREAAAALGRPTRYPRQGGVVPQPSTTAVELTPAEAWAAHAAQSEGQRWWTHFGGWGEQPRSQYVETVSFDGPFGRIHVPARMRQLIVPLLTYEWTMRRNPNLDNSRFECHYPDGAVLNLRLADERRYGIMFGGRRDQQWISESDYPAMIRSLREGREVMEFSDRPNFSVTRGDLEAIEPFRVSRYFAVAYEMPRSANQFVDSHFLILRAR